MGEGDAGMAVETGGEREGSVAATMEVLEVHVGVAGLGEAVVAERGRG